MIKGKRRFKARNCSRGCPLAKTFGVSAANSGSTLPAGRGGRRRYQRARGGLPARESFRSLSRNFRLQLPAILRRPEERRQSLRPMAGNRKELDRETRKEDRDKGPAPSITVRPTLEERAQIAVGNESVEVNLVEHVERISTNI
jgi:hypothetical protein